VGCVVISFLAAVKSSRFLSTFCFLLFSQLCLYAALAAPASVVFFLKEMDVMLRDVMHEFATFDLGGIRKRRLG
jgi:hypothetical protein